jgi:hypothetical protein
MKLNFQNKLLVLILALVLSLLLIVLFIVKEQFDHFFQENLTNSLSATNNFFQQYLTSLLSYRIEEPCRNLALAPRLIAAITEQDSLTILLKAQEEQENIGYDLFIVTDIEANPVAVLYGDSIINTIPVTNIPTINSALTGRVHADLVNIMDRIFIVASAPVYTGP